MTREIVTWACGNKIKGEAIEIDYTPQGSARGPRGHSKTPKDESKGQSVCSSVARRPEKMSLLSPMAIAHPQLHGFKIASKPRPPRA
jgi:hypothetical protein